MNLDVYDDVRGSEKDYYENTQHDHLHLIVVAVEVVGAAAVVAAAATCKICYPYVRDFRA